MFFWGGWQEEDVRKPPARATYLPKDAYQSYRYRESFITPKDMWLDADKLDE